VKELFVFCENNRCMWCSHPVPTPWYIQLVKNVPTLMEPQGSSAFFQNLAIGPYIEPIESCPRFCKICFSIILPSKPGATRFSFGLRFPTKMLHAFLTCPCMLHLPFILSFVI
jgi:hypothetical protein